MVKLLKRYGFAPTRIVTDKLRSYPAAFRSLGLSATHDRGLRANNRPENSHQPVRRREHKQQRFKSPGSAQRFLAIHAATYNTFYHQRHLLSRANYKDLRTGSFDAWAMASTPSCDATGGDALNRGPHTTTGESDPGPNERESQHAAVTRNPCPIADATAP
jgi:hypothetical protein